MLQLRLLVLRQAEEEALGRSESGFVGLDNQGATCYLNALLQVCCERLPTQAFPLFQCIVVLLCHTCTTGGFALSSMGPSHCLHYIRYYYTCTRWTSAGGGRALEAGSEHDTDPSTLAYVFA